MRRLLFLLLCLSNAVLADTNFWLIEPGNPELGPPVTEPHAFGATIEYRVLPNMREIADSRINLKVGIFIPDLGNVSFLRTGFNPEEGFVSVGEGDVQPDPRLPDSKISYNWYGVAPGAELSVTVYRGVMTARFSKGSTTWMIGRTDGLPVARKMDLSKFPGEPPEIGPVGKTWEPFGISENRLTPNFIDPVSVLVLYTPQARTEAGGQAEIDSLIEASIADMNQAFSNSGVNSVAIVNSRPNGNSGVEFNYNELSSPNPLCIGDACNFLYHRKYVRDNGATLRNTYAADLVVLMVADDFLCGVAYTQRPDCGRETIEDNCLVGANDYNAFAYSVVSSACAVTTRTFAHEVGHQFGMEHDPAVAMDPGEVPPSFLWSYGYSVYDGSGENDIRARTIMATECSPLSCPIQLHYSNPNINFLAFPTKVTGTFSSDAFGRSSFNARTAAALAEKMSGFRGTAITDRVFRNSFEALPLP